jgi:hypothetical protein
MGNINPAQLPTALSPEEEACRGKIYLLERSGKKHTDTVGNVVTNDGLQECRLIIL